MLGSGSRLRRALALLLAILLLAPSPAVAWWDTGHVVINRVAAQKVPSSMPGFLRKAADRVAYLGPEPDRWREKTEFSLKNSQEPDHYIDLERVADIPELPEGRYDFYRLLYAKRIAAKEHSEDFLPERVGLQPYITMEIYGRLKVAFREYRRLKTAGLPTKDVEKNIVLYAGWLGHYVADGSNPLHTTIHYNGWVGENPRGYTTSKDFHGDFEGRFVERNLSKLEFTERIKEPTRLHNPFRDYLQYLWDSNHLVERVYELEKAGLLKNDSPEAVEFVGNRFAAGAQMLLNLWYTAWEESAQPSASRPSS